MRKVSVIIFSLSLFSCHHLVSVKAQRLADTLATLKEKADFKPLNQGDAYDFMNKYYLPRLDSLRTGRKIFIHPLSGIDFKAFFNEDSTKLENEYATNPVVEIPKGPPKPPSILLDKKFSWDSKKLLGATMTDDNIPSSAKGKPVDSIGAIKAWHSKYGYGYMCVSYPQYNANTKIMVIREWVENNSFCGTGRENKFWFTRTPTGWKTDSYQWGHSQYKTKANQLIWLEGRFFNMIIGNKIIETIKDRKTMINCWLITLPKNANLIVNQ